MIDNIIPLERHQRGGSLAADWLARHTEYTRDEDPLRNARGLAAGIEAFRSVVPATFGPGSIAAAPFFAFFIRPRGMAYTRT
jgi:hypothetical protein